MTTENAREFSSAAKGETLEGKPFHLLNQVSGGGLLKVSSNLGAWFADTKRIIEGYSDIIIVMRHFESGAAKRAAVTSGIPIINGGDGPGQHPT